ncbi:hypothetical protein LZ30DRAFT_389067 [Colletotrichum cereale]|nr:hypothetical protein LZ30DRAFT_389067 [Colletotrichum cereale]
MCPRSNSAVAVFELVSQDRRSTGGGCSAHLEIASSSQGPSGEGGDSTHPRWSMRDGGSTSQLLRQARQGDGRCLRGKLSCMLLTQTPITYDHTHWRIRDPVRSPIDKPVRAGLVVESVTISEYLVLYVFLFFGSVTLLPTKLL